MARRGRFGRLPRRAPDLTGAIVAMMREYWNMQENIMVSSWREGGEVDGKQVTDQVLLDFWKERRDSVQEDDPLWDYYDQQHDQYKFAIEESKVGLQYAQHKMSARQVANWYKGQASNYVRDSEMYRTVMGQAAKFLDAAKAQSRASSQATRQKAYTRLFNQSQRDYAWPVDIVLGKLTSVLQGYGLLVGPQNQIQMTPEAGGPMGRPEGEQLTSLSVMGDAEKWDEVLAAINTPGSKYYDDFHGAIAEGRRDGLDISGPFDQTDIDALYRRKLAGIDHDIALAKRFHDVANKSDLPNLYALKQNTTAEWQFVRTQDEAGIYAQNRKNLNDILGDAAADPFMQMNAITNYYTANESLGRRLQPPGEESQNPLMSSLLMAEQRTLLGDPAGFAGTIWEGATQSPWFSGTGGGPEGESAKLSMWLTNLRDVVTKAAAGTHVVRKDDNGDWQAVSYSEISAETGGQFVVVPMRSQTTLLSAETTPGLAFGERPARAQADPDQGLLPMPVKTAMTVSYGQVYGVIPIIARAPAAVLVGGTMQAYRDPNTGRELGPSPNPEGDPNIGMVTYLPDGEGNLTMPVYGIYANNGELRWTVESPFKPGSTAGTSRQNVGGQESLIVNADPTAPGAMTYYVKKPDGTVAPQTMPPADPNTLVESRFNTFSIVDPMKQRPYDATTFISPGFAFVSSTPSGREEIAGWTAEETYKSFRADPFIQWNNPTATAEFWQDVGAVKSAEAVRKSPGIATRYSSEVAFYREIENYRQGDLVGNNIWNQTISKMQIGALMTTQAAKDYISARLSASGTPLTLAQRDERVARAAEQAARVSSTGDYAARGKGPFGPGYFGPPAPVQSPTAINMAATRGKGPFGPGYFGPPAPGTQRVSAQPQIKVPALPGVALPAGGAMTPREQTGGGYQAPAPLAPRSVDPTAVRPPGLTPPMLPPAPNPNLPKLPGVSTRPRLPHEYDPYAEGEEPW